MPKSNGRFIIFLSFWGRRPKNLAACLRPAFAGDPSLRSGWQKRFSKCFLHLTAHSLVLFTACLTCWRLAGYGGHSSNTIIISLPSASWISIDFSGVKKYFLPSSGSLNSTLSSLIFTKLPKYLLLFLNFALSFWFLHFAFCFQEKKPDTRPNPSKSAPANS